MVNQPETVADAIGVAPIGAVRLSREALLATYRVVCDRLTERLPYHTPTVDRPKLGDGTIENPCAALEVLGTEWDQWETARLFWVRDRLRVAIAGNAMITYRPYDGIVWRDTGKGDPFPTGHATRTFRPHGAGYDGYSLNPEVRNRGAYRKGQPDQGWITGKSGIKTITNARNRK